MYGVGRSTTLSCFYRKTTTLVLSSPQWAIISLATFSYSCCASFPGLTPVSSNSTVPVFHGLSGFSCTKLASQSIACLRSQWSSILRRFHLWHVLISWGHAFVEPAGDSSTDEFRLQQSFCHQKCWERVEQRRQSKLPTTTFLDEMNVVS